MGGKISAVDKPNILFQRPPCVGTARFVGVRIFIEGEVSRGTLVSAKWGRLQVADEKKSGRALFAIRPEHIRIQKEQCENSLAGVVQDCVYHGEHVEVQVVLDEQVIRARVPATAELAPSGTPVQVVLPKEHLFAINRFVKKRHFNAGI
ncbi:MAG: TOBE domain-containing protein [Anaerolineales bacterium]|nr:TOBE domain-containing protein [Anaerolineales bacterium]